MTKRIFIDMDDTICSFRSAYEHALKTNPEIRFPQATYGFFESLIPLPGAIEALQVLLEDDRFDPFILTAPSVRNPWCYTGKRVWVQEHLGLAFCHRLIISPRKDMLMGDYLIDDYDRGKGQEMFVGELIHFGGDQYPDWQAVMAKLMAI